MAILYSNSSINPPNTPPWSASQQNILSSQTYTGGPVSGSGSRNFFDGEGHNPEIEKKLRSLIPENPVITEFVAASSDDVIQVMGDVEPFFGRSLTALAEALLSCAPDPRSGYHYQLAWTGLFFEMPKVFAMPDRIGTSYVGLALLDHWAAQNKRFASYVHAYVDQEVRDRIAADCFAFGMGHMPKWIKDAIAHGEKLKRRWQEKEAQRQAVAMEHLRQEQMQRQRYYSQLNQLNQQITQQQLQTWASTSNGLTQANLVQSIATSSMSSGQRASLLSQLSGLFKNGS